VSATHASSDRGFRFLQGWGLGVAVLTLATGIWLTVQGGQVFLGAVADPFDRKVFAALNLGIPACLCGALVAWLAGQGRPWDGFRVAAAVLAALNLATILVWGVLDLVKSGAIRF
jgi:uncharacterized membrane protein (DUF441 family)